MSTPAPAFAPIPAAVTYSGHSRSVLYLLLSEGKIRAVKAGRTTLIDMESLRSHLASLPSAEFRRSRPSDNHAAT